MALSLTEFRDRILRFRNAWRALDPHARFEDLDLESFTAKTEDALAIRDEIRLLERKLAALRTRRKHADKQAAAVLDRLVNLVRGAPGHGDDSPFYRALGYIPTSERKTGLTRRRKTPPA